MAVLVSDVKASMQSVLLDPDMDTWVDADYVRFVTEAENQVCILKPDAYAIRGPITMVAGTRQDLPIGSTGLMDGYLNTASGRRITQVSRALLDEAARWYPAATQEKNVEHWVYDLRNPLTFDVFPPNDGTGELDMLYCLTPPALTAITDELNLTASYFTVIRYFALAEAYAANTTRADVTKVSFYRNEATKMLGINSQSMVAISPRGSAPGGSS